MVGVMVRERDRVDVPHPLAEELDPHLGRRVDQQVAAREARARRWAACVGSGDRSRCRPSTRSRSWERRWTFRSREKSAGASVAASGSVNRLVLGTFGNDCAGNTRSTPGGGSSRSASMASERTAPRSLLGNARIVPDVVVKPSTAQHRRFARPRQDVSSPAR